MMYEDTPNKAILSPPTGEGAPATAADGLRAIASLLSGIGKSMGSDAMFSQLEDDLYKWANELDHGYEGTLVILRIPERTLPLDEAERLADAVQAVAPDASIEVNVPAEEVDEPAEATEDEAE